MCLSLYSFSVINQHFRIICPYKGITNQKSGGDKSNIDKTNQNIEFLSRTYEMIHQKYDLETIN